VELFRDTKIDFIGRRFYFIAISGVLLVAGLISLVLKGGPKWGIDFKGGTLAYVSFKDAPDLDRLRSELNQGGLSVSTLQPFEASGGSHELKIDLDLPEDAAVDAGKNRIRSTLREIYGGDSSKLDLNNAAPDALAERLKANPVLALSPVSPERVEEAAAEIVAFRDTADVGGLIREFSQLDGIPNLDPQVREALQQETYLGPYAVRGVETVGPKIGADLQKQAVKATLFALLGMLVYMAFRFEWVYGVAAVIAVFHDIAVTVGFFSIFDREIDLTVVAALLTLVGYSMNDTIVIFDRVRENGRFDKRTDLARLLNLSVNQTLSRTVLTSGLTFITVLCLFLFGGEVLRGFSFCLVIGIIVGSYSSIFVASPIVLWWNKLFPAARSPKKSAGPAVPAVAGRR
jgi:preprotein translocase subunit SecF